MYFIDTHTHLYLSEFENDLAQVIDIAKRQGVRKFFLPAIDSAVLNDMLRVEASFAGECIAMIGLHPCSVKNNYRDELEIVEQWLGKRKFVAIGEIGLDYYWDKTYQLQQLDAFNIQMEFALKFDIPIVIHTRNAMRETIDAVRPYAVRGLRGIFHCFGDSLENANSIIDMGFFLGIGGVLTYRKSGLAEGIKDISLDHLVLETDSPYLTPVPFRGKRNESSYITIIAQRLAEIKAVSIEEIASRTTANAEKIFGK